MTTIGFNSMPNTIKDLKTSDVQATRVMTEAAPAPQDDLNAAAGNNAMEATATAEVGVFEESDEPEFSTIQIEEDIVGNTAGAYLGGIAPLKSIAHFEMLLKYIVELQFHNKVTMQFESCGVLPRVFNEMLGGESEDYITLPSEGEGDNPNMYEMLTVDKCHYMSCMDKILDEEYLKSVIKEATDSIYLTGEYIYTMVGPRAVDYNGEVKFIDTLRLNTYEMSVLISTLSKISGITVKHGSLDIDGVSRAVILFIRS